MALFPFLSLEKLILAESALNIKYIDLVILHLRFFIRPIKEDTKNIPGDGCDILDGIGVITGTK